MKIITTIDDLISYASDYGGDSWSDNEEQHNTMTTWLAYWFRDEAHKQDFRYGEDWEGFFESLNHMKIIEMVLDEFKEND